MPIFTNFAITQEKNSAWGFVNNPKRQTLDIIIKNLPTKKITDQLL